MNIPATPETPSAQPQTWTTTQLQHDYEVIGFQAPYVVVIRKSDNVKGSLEFSHSPRLYWGFTPDRPS